MKMHPSDGGLAVETLNWAGTKIQKRCGGSWDRKEDLLGVPGVPGDDPGRNERPYGFPVIRKDGKASRKSRKSVENKTTGF